MSCREAMTDIADVQTTNIRDPKTDPCETPKSGAMMDDMRADAKALSTIKEVGDQAIEDCTREAERTVHKTLSRTK